MLGLRNIGVSLLARIGFASILWLLAGAEVARAHSVSVGYVSTAANSITIYYGSYHGVTLPEGTVSLIGPVTVTKANGAVIATKPAGLIDGTNNFYAGSCSGGSLGTPTAWQSATFTGVPNGSYSIELTGSFSINWQPCDASISSGTTKFLLDTSPPVISNIAANITVYTPASSNSATATWTAPTAKDDVAIASLTSNYASGATFPIGTTTVTYTAKDTAGNATTASFTVTVIDNVPPVISNMPANITLTPPVGGTTAVATWTPPTAKDNSGAATLSANFASGASFPVGATTVIYTAQDAAGNLVTASFTVTVVDNAPPVIAGCPADQTLQATGPVGAVASWPQPTAKDSSGVIATVGSHAPGATFAIGSTTVTYTASNASGTVAKCSFSITIQDTTAPALAGVPADVTVEATSAAGASFAYVLPVASDLVSGSRPVVVSHAPGAVFPFTAPGPSVTIVTVTTADSASPPNTAKSQFTVTVRDTTPPTLSVPANITIEANGASGAAVSYAPATAIDAVDPAPGIAYSKASGTIFPIGTTMVTVSARDASNNQSTATFAVTVRDSAPPTLTGIPANVASQATGATGAVVNYVLPTATDLVSGPLTVMASHQPGSTFPIGVTTVTFTAIDGAGNTVTGSFQVTVADASAPIFAGIPANITIEATGPSGTAVSYAIPTATDAVDGVRPVTPSLPPNSMFPLGTTTVTFTAADLATPPNSATATFQVAVRDTTAPTIGAVGNIIVTAPDASGAAVTFPWPAVTDLVDAAPIVTSSIASGSILPVGVHIVTITATDTANNLASKTFTVTVLSPAQMAVTPPDGFAAAGPQGAQGSPFAPAAKTYVVTNDGQGAMDFTVTGAPAWATVSPAAGTLAPGASINVTLTLSAAADALAAATHNATLTFNNTTSGIGSATRALALTVTAPAALMLPPATAFTASGPQGGQGGTFAPTTMIYPLQNTGSLPLNFVVTGQPAWLTVAPASGTIPAGGTVSVSVALNSAASALPVGTVNTTLVFTNTTNNIGTGTRAVTLNVLTPARLVVSAADGFVSSGNQAGPFSPASKSYTLSNSGDVPLTYTATSDRGWIDVAAAAGTLPAGSSATLTIAINSTANALASGAYSGTVAITNVTSGLGTTSRPIALTVIPNGQVILKIASTEGDGVFKFTSSTSALSLSLTTVNGNAQSQPIPLKAGVYSVIANPPDGFGLTAVSCSDSDSTGSVATKSATINLAAAETVVCTFASANSRKKTTEIVGRFLSRRNDLIANSASDAGRQIDRLIEAGNHAAANKGSSSAPTDRSVAPDRLSGEAAASVGPPLAGRSALSSTAFAATGLGAQAANAETISRIAEQGRVDPWQSMYRLGLPSGMRPEADQDQGTSRLAFGASLSQVMRLTADGEQRKIEAARNGSADPDSRLGRFAAARPAFTPFDFWVQGQYSRFADDRNGSQSDGHFGVLHAGADYILNPRILMGIQGQFDSMRMRSVVNGSEIEGRGWMIGPYGTVRLSEHLFLQARAAAGQSQNTVSPYLTYVDQFSTRRWLASATLVGRWQYGALQFRPSASVTYIEDVSKAYVDGLGVGIPSIKSSLGQMKIGPEISYRHVFANGTSLEPRAGLQGIWNFAGDGNGTNFGDALAGPKEIRGRAELGLKLQSLRGMSLDLSANYDGIGSATFHSVGGKATVRIPLN